MPVHDKVKYHAERHPAQIAVDIAGATLSWQQLWQSALALYQTLLRERPAGGSGIVAIAAGNDITFPVAWLAASAQPFTAAIIDPQTPAAQLNDILHRLNPDCLLLPAGDQTLKAQADRLSVRWRDIDGGQSHPDVSDDSAFTGGMQAGTPFLINFTSGTTSLPKAFIRSRRSWRASLENGEAIFGLQGGPSTLFPGPLSNGIGLYCLNETLYAGGTFYSPGRWQPESVLALIARQQIERLVVVPTMIAGFARAVGSAACPSLRGLVSAGAKLELNHYRQARMLFPAARIQEYYGASELGFIAVSTPDEADIQASLATVGQAFPGVHISICDDDGKRLSHNQPGTIYIRSEQIIDRYLWGDEGSAFVKQGAIATAGDIGYLDEKQCLHVIGRRGNMILSGGNNIYLAEIESAIKSLPGIIEAVVIAVDDEYAGKKMVAIVEAAADDLHLLPQRCRSVLAKYKQPHQFYHITRWPLTPGGKIERAGLEKRIAQHGSSTELTELSA
ncbi:class I adenylate-forming enzyme family protein [Erwinia persicina]|uniref:class I adenylate-forming enzyme family protein n=1 Tax=Erwinia persicina TaxID=55211 RepID=UPI0017854835|nr:AMP-binding protein [Erwinia persicina]MBD8214995.1 AMP-binding protein [Erwinia persicina]